MRTFYICYFAGREPLVQTQVLPYMRYLVAHGIEVSLLTYEPRFRRAWSPEEVSEYRDRLHCDGIRWFALPYHKSPSLLATLYDIWRGAWLVVRESRTNKI